MFYLYRERYVERERDIYIYIYTHMYIILCIICMCIYIYTHTYIHNTYIYIYTHILIYIYIHICIHINKCSWLKLFTLLDLRASSLRRGRANILCIFPIWTDDPRRESSVNVHDCKLSVTQVVVYEVVV